MFAPLSIAVVYLSSRHPDEGGLYVWSKIAFGPFAGFMTGWTYWASNLPYFPALLYFAAGNALFVTGSKGGALSASPWYFIAVAIGGLTLATIVNIYGLQVGKWLNNFGAVARWTVTLLLVALGRAGMVEVRSGDARQCHDDPARIRAQGSDLLVGHRICMDRARSDRLYGR